MEGIVINVMSKAKKTAQIKNLGSHNYQKGKATGNRDDDLKKYNFDILQMQGMETVENYNQYVKNHMHVGYKAHKEKLEEGDFVLPRDSNEISKVESIIVAPDVKILLKDLPTYDFSELQCFFDDYIFQFMKKDSKLKDVKILSAKVHCNEVFYPRFKEVEEDGIKKLVKLSKEESYELAYIKPHMHTDYIPLVEAEKDGVKFLKCSSKEIWKAQKGRYFDSFREYNDRFYEAIGKTYGINRGQKWEEWDERVQKKNNGEAVKKTIRLSEWQIKREEEMNNKYIEQLERERDSYSKESQEYRNLTAKIEVQKEEVYNKFVEEEMHYKKQLAEMQDIIRKALEEKDLAVKKRNEEIAKTDKMVQKENEMQKEVQNLMTDLEKSKELYTDAYNRAKEKISEVDDTIKLFAKIELALKNKEISDVDALNEIRKGKLDDKIAAFTKESAPELARIRNLFIEDDPR